MNFLHSIKCDVMPFLAPYAPSRYPKLIPSRLLNRLGEFDPERWTKVLRRFKCDLLINEHEHDMPVTGEFDSDRDYILIQITDTKVEDLPFLLLQTLMHEMIHVNQTYKNPESYYVPSDVGLNEFLNYLSLNGEIEAFSHCLFLETMQGTPISDCYTMKMYEKTTPKVQKKFMRNYRVWKKHYKEL
jgi:hypothetical protein